MLEAAARTADQLVADAKAEAESLVSTAQATAHQIGEASRNEAATMAAELSRTRAEQRRQIGEAGVTHDAGGTVEFEQARGAARFRGLLRDELIRKFEIEVADLHRPSLAACRGRPWRGPCTCPVRCTTW